jgi:hypothetical protein
VDLASIVAGAIVGTVIGWMGKEFLPPLWRRIQGRPPVIIHVETNPAVFEAGLPPWIGYGFVFADDVQPGRPPPGPCQEWWAWAKESGGVDAGVTKLRLTLIGDELTTVVIDALRVVITSKLIPLMAHMLFAPSAERISQRDILRWILTCLENQRRGM